MILFFQLVVRCDTLQALRQCTCQIIIYGIMCISINGWANQDKEQDNKYVEMIYYPFRYSGEIRQNNLMLCLLDCLVENQNHRWQYGYTTDNSKYNTLCHNHTKIHTKCEAHEAKCDKSGYGCDGTTNNR